jgi:hypothetical protein
MNSSKSALSIRSSSTPSTADNQLNAALTAHPIAFQAALQHRILTTPPAATASSRALLTTSACAACLRPWLVGVSVRVRLVRKRDRRRFVNSVVYSCLHCSNVLALPAAPRGALKAALRGAPKKKRKKQLKSNTAPLKSNVPRPANKSFKKAAGALPQKAAARPPPPTDAERIAAVVRAAKPAQAQQKQKGKLAATATKQPSLLSQFLSAL